MAKLPFMPLYVADYQGDTRCLSLATRGAWMDILCTLWKAPTRGRRQLPLEGWAGEIGKPVSEVSAALAELVRCEVGKISFKTLEGNVVLVTIQSGRMLRDEAQRKRKAKNKKDQRDREMSPGESPPDSTDVTGLSTGYFRNQSSEVRSHKEERRREDCCGCCGAPGAHSTAEE
jgi:uncharacterized protein YdaU (DUF1376 family)